MDDPVDIWCGPEVVPRNLGRRRTVPLNLVPQFNNVRVKIENITKKLARNLPPVVLDLIEIASYVYAGDQSVARGGMTLPGDGKDWKREFVFHIPVRCLDLWQSSETMEALIKTLQFLSDDFYEFNFREAIKTVDPSDYFDFDEGRPWFDADRVMLFSGGLDSLAGLCETFGGGTEKTILVSHRPAPQTDSLQKNLLADFVQLTGSRNQLLHVPVWINKAEKLTKDTHQRTRSFLYASLAASLAHMHDLSKAYFYENGITSSNLAIGPSVLGARSSRTTHPKVLKDFTHLFSIVLDQPFSIENPFFWKTKAEVVKTILECGAATLIRYTRSCSHVRTGDPIGNHCGVCSQCIGRRLAILTTSAESDDPEDMYRIKLPLDPIPKDSERAMVELIVKSAREFQKSVITDFFFDYAQAMDIVTSLPTKADESATRLFDLHKRHGQQVCSVLEQVVASSRGKIVRGEVPANSLLSMIVRQPITGAASTDSGCSILLPEGTTWEGITIEIVGNDAAKIFVGGQYHTRTAFEMGFEDKRRKLANRLWNLLCEFAEAKGTLAWESKERSREWDYKDFQRLRNTLRKFFGLRDDPFLRYDKETGYRTRFQIYYDRTIIH